MTDISLTLSITKLKVMKFEIKSTVTSQKYSNNVSNTTYIQFMKINLLMQVVLLVFEKSYLEREHELILSNDFTFIYNIAWDLLYFKSHLLAKRLSFNESDLTDSSYRQVLLKKITNLLKIINLRDEI